MTVLLRGSNDLILAEPNHLIQDAQCMVRSMVKVKEHDLIERERAAETEVLLRLGKLSMTQEGLDSHCFQVYVDALEVIPTPSSRTGG